MSRLLTLQDLPYIKLMNSFQDRCSVQIIAVPVLQNIIHPKPF